MPPLVDIVKRLRYLSTIRHGRAHMFVTQNARNRWYVVLGWTGKADDLSFDTKAEAERRMQELRAGR